MLLSSSKQKGFTLIELLVVISIIALLSSVVLSSLSTARAKARDARRLSDLRQIDTAIQMYVLDNNTPPLLDQGRFTSDQTSWTQQLGVQLKPYLSSIPVDPSTGVRSRVDQQVFMYMMLKHVVILQKVTMLD